MGEQKREAEPLTREENTQLAAEVLAPILELVDHALENFDEDRLRATMEKMEGQVAQMEALPFPETLNRADAMKESTGLFEKVVEMVELRKAQRAAAMKRGRGTPGTQVLRALGLG